MLCARVSTSVQRNERGQKSPGRSLRVSGRHRLRVLLRHGLPDVPLRDTWASPLPNSLTMRLLVSNSCPQMLTPVQQNIFHFGLSWAGKKGMLFETKRKCAHKGGLSLCAASSCREAFGSVSPFSSFRWGQLGCFSTPSRNKCKTECKNNLYSDIMALRGEWHRDSSFVLSPQMMVLNPKTGNWTIEVFSKHFHPCPSPSSSSSDKFNPNTLWETLLISGPFQQLKKCWDIMSPARYNFLLAVMPITRAVSWLSFRSQKQVFIFLEMPLKPLPSYQASKGWNQVRLHNFILMFLIVFLQCFTLQFFLVS